MYALGSELLIAKCESTCINGVFEGQITQIVCNYITISCAVMKCDFPYE